MRTSKADPYFSYCASGKDCPRPSQLNAPLPTPVTLPPPLPAPAVAIPATSKPAPKMPVKRETAPHPSNAALRTATGLSIAFLYKSATFPAVARPLLEHWLQAKDQPGSRYLVIVHSEDSGPISHKLAQERGDAVSDAIHQLLPPRHLNRASVFDPYGRQVVVVIEPIQVVSMPSAAPAAPMPSPSASVPLHPTSAAPLAQPPKTVPSVSHREGSQEKSP